MTFAQNNNMHFKSIVARSKGYALNVLELLTKKRRGNGSEKGR